jgi:general secretion pathway protein B
MSYILDALRKSEQQRLQGEAPLLVTTQTSFRVSKQPALLIYGFLAAILICAGILIGWLRPWQQDKTDTVKDSVALAQQETKPPQIAPMPQPTSQAIVLEPEKPKKYEPVLPTQKPIPATKLASKAESTEQVAPVPARVEAQPRKSQTSADLPKSPEQKSPEQKASEQKIDEAATPSTEKAMPPSPEPNSANDTHSPTEEAAQQNKIMAMSELPHAIQQEIPAMSISGYAASNIPKERSVGINDRLLQEGEYLAPGLRLEQITEDGLVFSYKKYLFRHSL